MGTLECGDFGFPCPLPFLGFEGGCNGGRRKKKKKMKKKMTVRRRILLPHLNLIYYCDCDY